MKKIYSQPTIEIQEMFHQPALCVSGDGRVGLQSIDLLEYMKIE